MRKYSYTSGMAHRRDAGHDPPAGSILRADVVPGYGGDTTSTNLVAAYEGLSEPVPPVRRHLVGGAPLRGQLFGTTPSVQGSQRAHREGLPCLEPPVVRVHPRTGEHALFVNPGFVDHILDVDPLESRWILDHLFAEITRPEYTVRFRWAPGSVAFWDNRATAHLGPQDLGHVDVERVLHRVTLIGEVPVGPDGRGLRAGGGCAIRGRRRSSPPRGTEAPTASVTDLLRSHPVVDVGPVGTGPTSTRQRRAGARRARSCSRGRFPRRRRHISVRIPRWAWRVVGRSGGARPLAAGLLARGVHRGRGGVDRSRSSTPPVSCGTRGRCSPTC